MRQNALVKGLQLHGLTNEWQEFDAEDNRFAGAVLGVSWEAQQDLATVMIATQRRFAR